jgi:transposase
VPAVDITRHIWIQNYQWEDNQRRWRASDAIPPSTHFLSSPYDLEAHYARKHTTQRIGYKVHLTETCDDELPHLITNVETKTAPVPKHVAHRLLA